MKIRTGFVSNSSSSSFVVFYQLASIDDLGDNDVNIIGGYTSDEGRDYWHPDQATCYHIQNCLLQNNIEIVRELAAFHEHDRLVDVTDLITALSSASYGTRVFVQVFERSHYPPDGLAEFTERYEQ